MTMIPAASIDLAGRRVLLVEDEYVIAMDIEDMLRALGAGEIDVTGDAAHALAHIERTPPAFAILDLKLRNGTTEHVAAALRARAIPFAFVTGYGDLSALPAPLRDAPLVRKPIDRDQLYAAIAALRLDQATRRY
jgi:CheY-like chemotaxis protein